MRVGRAAAIPAALGLAALALGPADCVPPVDPSALAAVQVDSKIEPPEACRALGPLEGKDTDRWAAGGLSYEAALIDLRRKAVNGGGNRLVVDEVALPRAGDYLPAFVIQARLFACPAVGSGAASASVVPAANAATPPAPSCEPDCSPGYTCLRGACVSACNPLCSSGERCGVDRICRADSTVTIPAPPPASSPR
ncbi:MAG: hypothetical protein ABJE95_08240 [Byssovorax sp.]